MTNSTTITFPDFTAVTEFFSALDYRKLPVHNIWAACGYSDDGIAVITFARQHLADRLTYTLTEQPRRG